MAFQSRVRVGPRRVQAEDVDDAMLLALLAAVCVICFFGVDAVVECPEHRFACSNRCLREQFRCDGKVDCNFAEDEYDCTTCKQGAFKCLENVSKTSSTYFRHRSRPPFEGHPR